MPSNCVTPNANLVCSLAEYKLHLRMDATNTAEDSDLTIKLWTAQSDMEERTGRRQFLESTWELRLENWPHDEDIDLDIPQVQSVTSVKYTPAGAAEVTLSSALYKLVGGYDKTNSAKQTTGKAEVTLAYGQYWPTDTLDTGEPIAIRYVAGWKDAASVPYPLKAAILLQAESLYRNRSAVMFGTFADSRPLADGVARLIGPYCRF